MKLLVVGVVVWCGCGDNYSAAPYEFCDGWHQWGNDPSHTGASCAEGQPLEQMLADIEIDPFAAAEEKDAGGDLVIHYQVPLIDGDDVFVMKKAGLYTPCPIVNQMPDCAATNMYRLNSETWTEARYTWQGGRLVNRWSFASDWKPEPQQSFEPMFQPVLIDDEIAVPGASGSIWLVDRESGAPRGKIAPFDANPDIYVAGAITEFSGNLYYNAIELDHDYPYGALAHAWLVAVTPHALTVADYQDLVPGAPGSNDGCYGYLEPSTQPLPPGTPQPPISGTPPQFPCGRQVPGLNTAPTFALDGTMYVVTHAQFNSNYSYLVSVEATELHTNWARSLRDLLHDGCGVLDTCPDGSPVGVDPYTDLAPAGAVDDASSSMPVALPDGTIIYGAYTAYNGSRGHLLAFDHDGNYRASYDFGWDTTPAVVGDRIVLKENDYVDNGPYQLTSLDSSLRRSWQFNSTETESCVRNPDGSITCTDDHPNGFEWCINAPAVDRDGTMFANSEDGHLYAVTATGELRDRFFLGRAQGAAYTPVAIDHAGRIYALNGGDVYVIGASP